MKITWIGHSCFRIEQDGYTVILDPYADGSVPGLLPVREKADEVFCSHGHADHNAERTVTLSGEKKESPFTVEAIKSWHDNKHGLLRGRNTIRILEASGIRIAHLGDLGCDLTPEQVEKLHDLTVLLIPVGGHYTINAAQAAAVTKKLNPKITIPMHFSSKNPAFGYDVIGPVSDFLELFDRTDCRKSSDLDPGEEAEGQVIVLTPKNL